MTDNMMVELEYLINRIVPPATSDAANNISRCIESLRQALSAPRVPEGFTFKRDGNDIRVAYGDPFGKCGHSAWIGPNPQETELVLLRKLAEAMLSAAPAPDHFPEAGKMVTQHEPRCECHSCIKRYELKGPTGRPLSSEKMILCPTCGNKRCPQASDHTLKCTGSNEPGQRGSIYANDQEKSHDNQ